MASFGRQLIADPEYPNKLFRDQLDDVRPCIRCNEYCVNNVMTGEGTACSVNAEAGEENHFFIRKAANPKKAVVVGGGCGGMEVARVVALSGHEVTLFEKSSELGGTITAAATPDFKRELMRLAIWFAKQMKDLDVKVVLNHEVTADDKALAEADSIICACGNDELFPAIPGIDNAKVVGVVKVHRDPSIIKGEHIVVCGGGLSGCDFAIETAMTGKKVTIIEIMNTVGILATMNPP